MTSRDDLVYLVRRLVRQIETAQSDSEGHYPVPDAGCFDCTVGTVPDRLNTGLCAYHRALVVLNAEDRG